MVALRPSLALALLVGASMAALVPAAEAHCDGIVGKYALVDKCLPFEQMENLILELNAQENGRVAYVLLHDHRFHPENVTLRSGGTVEFVWLDYDSNEQHDPRSSGSTGSPLLDVLRPPPDETKAGRCFDVLADTGDLLDKGDRYPINFTFLPVEDVLQKTATAAALIPRLSGNSFAGSSPFPQPTVTCPGTTFSRAADGSIVIPYHCGVHGRATTPVKDMRGAITLVEA